MDIAAFGVLSKHINRIVLDFPGLLVFSGEIELMRYKNIYNIFETYIIKFIDFKEWSHNYRGSKSLKSAEWANTCGKNQYTVQVWRADIVDEVLRQLLETPSFLRTFCTIQSINWLDEAPHHIMKSSLLFSESIDLNESKTPLQKYPE